MIFPFSNYMQVRDEGWTIFESPSPEATRIAASHFAGKIGLTTQVTPRPNAKGALATDLEMELHTDHPRVHWIVWHCVRQSSAGGHSLFKDARAALERLDRATIRALRETTMGSHQVFPGDQERYPVLRSQGDTRNWVYYTPWMRREGASEALDAFAAALAEVPTAQVRLEPGQVLVLNNARMLHGRTAIGGDRDRLLIRHWVGDGRDNFGAERHS